MNSCTEGFRYNMNSCTEGCRLNTNFCTDEFRCVMNSCTERCRYNMNSRKRERGWGHGGLCLIGVLSSLYPSERHLQLTRSDYHLAHMNAALYLTRLVA